MIAPPRMAPWNLSLRFGLEVAAVAGLAAAAWRTTDGPWRWVATVGAPLAAALLWTVFNVPGDPSRSGNAPVEVTGRVRLVIELSILAAGAMGFALSGPRAVGVALVALVVVHYALSTARIGWLLGQ